MADPTLRREIFGLVSATQSARLAMSHYTWDWELWRGIRGIQISPCGRSLFFREPELEAAPKGEPSHSYPSYFPRAFIPSHMGYTKRLRNPVPIVSK
jgi:hypothetical protein